MHLFERLCSQRINQNLKPATRSGLAQLEVHASLDSTNKYLLEQQTNLTQRNPPQSGIRVCAAEYQEQGRGRRGKTWLSQPGEGLLFSLLHAQGRTPSCYSGLSLVMGIGVCRALHLAGLTEARLKWPNDILVNQQKLAGILTEITTHTTSHCCAIVGIGLNYKMTNQSRAQVDQPCCDVLQLYPNISRNDLLASLLNELIPLLQTYPEIGLHPFLKEWAEVDCLYGQQVTVTQSDKQPITGQVTGLGPLGELLIQTDSGQVACYSGEVSVRAD